MSKKIVRCFIHFVWATKGRAALLSPADDDFVSRTLRAQCLRLRCKSVAIGVNDDHVHVLVAFGCNTSLGGLAAAMKGASAYLFNQSHPDRRLEWQAGWAAFSVFPAQVEVVARYVHEQRVRHANRQTIDVFELAR